MIDIALNGPIARITLSAPDRRNALTIAAMGEMSAALDTPCETTSHIDFLPSPLASGAAGAASAAAPSSRTSYRGGAARAIAGVMFRRLRRGAKRR